MRKMMKSLMAGKARLSCFNLASCMLFCGKLGRKTTACWMLRSGTNVHSGPCPIIIPSSSIIFHLPVWLWPATPRGNIPMTLELSPKHHIVTTSVSWSLVLPLFETSFDRYGSQAAHHPQSQRASCTHSCLMPRNDRYFFRPDVDSNWWEQTLPNVIDKVEQLYDNACIAAGTLDDPRVLMSRLNKAIRSMVESSWEDRCACTPCHEGCSDDNSHDVSSDFVLLIITVSVLLLWEVRSWRCLSTRGLAMIMLGSKMFEEWALCHADVETMVWSVHFPKSWTLDFSLSDFQTWT